MLVHAYESPTGDPYIRIDAVGTVLILTIEEACELRRRLAKVLDSILSPPPMESVSPYGDLEAQ